MSEPTVTPEAIAALLAAHANQFVPNLTTEAEARWTFTVAAIGMAVPLARDWLSLQVRIKAVCAERDKLRAVLEQM